jgi:hypothetical protein
LLIELRSVKSSPLAESNKQATKEATAKEQTKNKQTGVTRDKRLMSS